jgi:hypothetical protein
MGNCKLEAQVRDALDKAGISYVVDGHPDAQGLDFYLPESDIAIEVKQFHTDRIAEQMSRKRNVIALQGAGAVAMFCAAIDKP